MSFNLDLQSIIQYGYNVFASALPYVYLIGGAAFGVYILNKILATVRG